MEPLSGRLSSQSPSAVRQFAAVRLDDVAAVVPLRHAAVAAAAKVGLSDHRRGEVEIVVNELATNAIVHGGGGMGFVSVVEGPAGSSGEPGVVELTVFDRGPGIEPARLVAGSGSTAGTLGIGLNGALRLASEIVIDTTAQVGTAVVARLGPARLHQGAAGSYEVAGLRRPLSGETRCGDGWTFAQRPGEVRLFMVDGLGHGPLAADAADLALDAFNADPWADPVSAMARIGESLRGSRGAAVGLAVVDDALRTAAFVGVGNVAASLLSRDRRHALLSTPGVAGQRTRTIRRYDVALSDPWALVMHTDGLTERWEWEPVAKSARRAPALAAAALMRDAARERDDACVAVVTPSVP